MRDIFFDLSVRSVRLNFLRSLLASIGIVIGVVAISSMGMLGTNMQLSVKDQLSSNVNTVMLTSDVVKVSTTGNASASNGIDASELNDIQSAAGQNVIVPIHHTSSQFTIASTNGRGAIYGLNPNDIPKFLNISEGSNIKGGNDALVGATIATNFNMGIGSSIKIGQNCQTIVRPVLRVAGILVSRGIASDGVNADNAIIVSDQWYTDHFGDKNVYDQVNVILQDVSTINQTEANIDRKVNRNSDVIRISDASSGSPPSRAPLVRSPRSSWQSAASHS